MNAGNSLLAHAKAPSQIILAFNAFQGENFSRLYLGEFGKTAAFASGGRAVIQLIGFVFCFGFPRKMTSSNAAEVAFPA